MALRIRIASVLASALTLAAVPAPTVAAADCAGADDSPATIELAAARQATLCLLNQERASRELPKLRENTELRGTAQSYARLMVRERFFDHVSPGGSTMLQRIKRGTDYLAQGSSWAVGENLAWGAGGAETPRRIVQAWMRSPGHKRNILDRRFRDLGIGIAEGAPTNDVSASSGASTYATTFGRRG